MVEVLSKEQVKERQRKAMATRAKPPSDQETLETRMSSVVQEMKKLMEDRKKRVDKLKAEIQDIEDENRDLENTITDLLRQF